MNKIKKGDDVLVIAGKDKGKRGKVLSMQDNGEKFIIEGINLVSKCVKPDPNKGDSGGIKKIEKSIHRSNVMLIDPTTDKGTRVGIKLVEHGKRVRFCKKSNQQIES